MDHTRLTQAGVADLDIKTKTGNSKFHKICGGWAKQVYTQFNMSFDFFISQGSYKQRCDNITVVFGVFTV